MSNIAIVLSNNSEVFSFSFYRSNGMSFSISKEYT